ncbi:MAG: glycosyltransferase family 4 protein [Candidatus Rokubacteria bacterium]|nr:glycosyltransferase family 4 protein [Candidatus Rokubacteria bacterium]
MAVGFLPALGSGIRALAETGQQSRLLDAYMRPYADAFGEVCYFSYLAESLDEFTSEPALLDRVRVLAPGRPMSRGRRAVTMVGAHAAEFRRCSVLRVFQITGVIPALRAKRRFGIPYVTTYGFWYGRLSRPGPKRVLKAVVERLGLRHAAAVIATTEELRVRAARLAPRVELIPNGVDLRLFRPGDGERARGRRIVYVGRLSPEKNLQTVVEATASAGAGATLRLAGSGPLRADLDAQARAQGGSVEFLGVVEQAKLPAVYTSSDVFVLASFTEGHPKVLLEAMACGLPCVASDCAGNRSLITDGETGLLFDPHRPEELAARLRQVFDDPALAARLGKAARKMIVERYDLSTLVAREIALMRVIAAR